jgi:hypothetical protein
VRPAFCRARSRIHAVALHTRPLFASRSSRWCTRADAAYTNYAAPALQVRNLEVAHDPDELLSAAPPTSAAGGGSGASVAAAEAPIRGSGPGGYDFEAMIEAELRRSAAQAPPAPQ